MADISHQLKTPITSMMIMADLLEDAEPEKQKEFIHNIRFSLNKMEWLVGALLKMAKLDAHVIEYSPKGHTIEIDSGENPMYDWISVKDSENGMDKDQGGDIDVDFGEHGQGTTFIIKYFK